MTEKSPRHEISFKRVVYEIPGMDAVTIQHDVEYRKVDADALTVDVYYPAGAAAGSRIPAVVIVAGYPDRGYEKGVGCRFKDIEMCVSWGRLLAASGLAAVTYANQEPVADLDALLHYLSRNAGALGIDESRIGVYAFSGCGPLGLSVLMGESRDYLKCAVLSCAYVTDCDGSTGTADAARQWGFVNPCAGTSVDDLPPGVPLFIARAGHDAMPGLNDALDRFIARALARNLPITFVNHASAPHAFEILDDSETSRKVIRQMLAFLRFHLLR